jgi:hypothetical protein
MPYTNALIDRVRGDIAHSRQRNESLQSLMSQISTIGSGKVPAVGGSGITPPSGVKISGNVDQWIKQAYSILGIPLSATALAHERFLINKESGGNPRAINRWDSNAKKGTPSIGLAQTIGPTFNSYKVAGHGDIYNPVDNLIASLRYRRSRYGSYDIGNYKGGY